MSETRRTALIATLGNTVAPVTAAIEKARAEGELSLYLVYGAPIGDQESVPGALADDIVVRARELGVATSVFQIPDPENMEDAVAVCRAVMSKACQAGAERVVLDFTGGTKAMSAALVFAAMGHTWDCEVVFEYGGGPRDAIGRVTDTRITRLPNAFVEEQARQVIVSLRAGEYARALALLEFLPKAGRLGFLKKAALILHDWDGFHYELASTTLGHCARQCADIGGDADYATLAGTITRLDGAWGTMGPALKLLRRPEELMTDVWRRELLPGHLYLLGDVIANARRRAAHHPVDCVLRCYRAVEVATQIAELSAGINPWKPDWKKVPAAVQSRYLTQLSSKSLPAKISLFDGFRLVGLMTTPFDDRLVDDLRDLMESRNLSYLEHGYKSRTTATAQTMLGKMERLVVAVISRTGAVIDPMKYAEQMRLEC